MLPIRKNDRFYMDVVNVPTYDGFQAVGTALRMATRITGQSSVLLPANMGSDKLSMDSEYLKPGIAIEQIPFDPESGLLDLAILKTKLNQEVAAVSAHGPDVALRGRETCLKSDSVCDGPANWNPASRHWLIRRIR